jgi:hypothetical protein
MKVRWNDMSWYSKEQRNERYQKVFQITQDSAVARRYRDFGQERYKQELSKLKRIKKRTKAPQLTPRQIAYWKTRKRKEAYAIRLGYTPEEARKVSWRSIPNISKKAPSISKGDDTRLTYGKTLSKQQRKASWINWAKAEKYPEQIRQLVESINMDLGFDPNAKYGWAIAYYAYKDNKSIEEIMKQYQPLDFSGERYEDIIRSARFEM